MLHLLNADVDSLPRTAGVGNTPSALELLRAEVCNLLAGLLDHESSHVEPAAAEALLQCAGADDGRATTPMAASAAAPAMPVAQDHGGVSALVAHASSTAQIMPLLDAASKNNFAGMVLFGVLPQVRSSSSNVQSPLQCMAPNFPFSVVLLGGITCVYGPPIGTGSAG